MDTDETLPRGKRDGALELPAFLVGPALDWNRFVDRIGNLESVDPSGRERHRLRAGINCIAVAFAVYGALGALELGRGHYGIGIALTGAALASLLFLIAFRSVGRPSFLAHGMTTLTYALAGGVTVSTGGAGPGALFLLTIPPVLAAHLAGMRAALGWAAICAATIGLTAALYAVGVDFPVELHQDTVQPRFRVALATLVALLAVALSWENLHNRMLQFSEFNAQRAREDRRQALASAEHYRALAEASSDLVMEIEPNGTIAFASANSEALLGVPPRKLVGRSVGQFLDAEQRMLLQDSIESLVETGSASFDLLAVRHGTEEKIRIVGEIRAVEGWDRRDLRLVTVRAAAMSHPQTERSKPGAEMDTVARAARGIAHDLLSYLTVATGNAELAKEASVSAAQRNDYLDEVVAASLKAGRLTRELLALGGEAASNQSELFINSLVQRFVPIAARIAGEDVELETRLDPRVSRVLVDPTHVERILLNLVANAREVIPGRGRVEIGTVYQVDENTQTRECVLYVEDDGPGMTEEIRERIFDTAFSTKTGSGRRGFGLAIVRDLARAARGEVSVRSEPGRGARFEVVLPIVEELTAAPHRAAMVGTPGRSVLVLNSEEAIRSLLQQTLEPEGFRVECVASEDAALAAVSRGHPFVEVLIAEHDQTGYDAYRVARKARELLPRLGVVILTKDPSSVHEASGVVGVQRPYQRAELVRAVRASIVRSSHSPSQLRT